MKLLKYILLFIFSLLLNVVDANLITKLDDFITLKPTLLDNTTIVEFEFKYADNILNKADVFANGIKYEFKSWTPFTQNPWNSFFAGTGESYTQFIRYLQNSNSLNELKYIFNANKTNTTTVKNAFKDLFQTKQNEIFQTIWNNTELRGSLFGANISRADAELDFINLINELDNSSISNSILYTFIKIE